tara:strand:- start:475 stop:1023 length:549 start_codon:yes stop_codon:yes gene_type:complete
MDPDTQIFVVVVIFVVLSVIVNKLDKKEMGEALIAESTIKCFRKFATFEGRASRSEFWPFYLLCTFSNVITYIIDLNYLEFENGFGTATAIFNFVTIVPLVAVSVRRLQDVGKSGWWFLIGFTGIGLMPLLIWWSDKGGKELKKSTKNKSTLTDELRDLKELYNEGTLSKEEFIKAKEKILK